ncbi:hypothetical protein [Streptomyces sp. NPDC058424]|uniref:hypothetical protein n=1 Tax=Streptomyces sp. NPDC058424 TaxID=3346491 RepID=UPI00365ED80F
MTAADGDAETPKGDAHGRMLWDAERMDKWSIGWVLVAMVMWGVLAVLMLSSYGPDASSWDSAAEPRCKGPLLAPFQRDSSVCHSELRQWPALLGFLALAVIPTIIAAAVTVYAKLLSRLAMTLGETDGEKNHETA